MSDSWYSEEHKALQTTLKKIIDTDINPNVDQWENEGQYPAHEVFKKLGDAGLMGELWRQYKIIVELFKIRQLISTNFTPLLIIIFLFLVTKSTLNKP